MNYNINKIYDTEIPKILNKFLNYLFAIEGKSINTINGYKSDLSLFFKFIKIYKVGITQNIITELDKIKINDINYDLIKEIELDDLIAFITFLKIDKNNSNYARARKVASLKSFFKYLKCKAKIINEDPSEELESPKLIKRNPIYLTLDESRRLLQAIDGKNKERDYCIIMFFLNCGLRLSELCNININEINYDTLTVIGKGNKERTIYLNKACISALENYLPIRDKIIDMVPPEHSNALFISSKKMRISARAVERMVKKYIEKAGLDKNKYSPHKLRHTAATLMYKHGNVDIRSLQVLLGHENVSTTQIYTHVDDEKLREAVSLNPLSSE